MKTLKPHQRMMLIQSAAGFKALVGSLTGPDTDENFLHAMRPFPSEFMPAGREPTVAESLRYLPAISKKSADTIEKRLALIERAN